MGLIRKAIRTAFLLAEDAIDRIGDPRISTNMLEARNRASELALENARLEADNARLTEELNSLRDDFEFNGPTLFSDEVDALRKGVKALEHFTDDYDLDAANALSGLLQRSDHMGITQKELMRRAHDAINGVGVHKEETARWNESPVTEDFWKEDD